jgi:hypothetical protein
VRRESASFDPYHFGPCRITDGGVYHSVYFGAILKFIAAKKPLSGPMPPQDQRWAQTEVRPTDALRMTGFAARASSHDRHLLKTPKRKIAEGRKKSKY